VQLKFFDKCSVYRYCIRDRVAIHGCVYSVSHQTHPIVTGVFIGHLCTETATYAVNTWYIKATKPVPKSQKRPHM